MAETRTEVQVRLLFERRTVELFQRIQHLAPMGLTLVCFDGDNVAWKSSSPVVGQLIAASVRRYAAAESFVVQPSSTPLDARGVFELMPQHFDVQWAVFFGTAVCVGYVSNCNRADIAKILPGFIDGAVAYSSQGGARGQG